MGQAVLLPGLGRQSLWKVCEERIDHRIADERDPVVCDSFTAKVVDRTLRVREQEGAEVIRDLAIVLLRHRLVEAAQPRLEVCDRDEQFHGRDSRGEGGIDIAWHHDEVPVVAR